MSDTFDIGCLDCQELLLIGQGPYDRDDARGVLYRQDATFLSFLLKHEGHALRFGGEHYWAARDAESWSRAEGDFNTRTGRREGEQG